MAETVAAAAELPTVCGRCGVEAPTRYVEFRRLYGMAPNARSEILDGEFCRSCIFSVFLHATESTALLGWFGSRHFVYASIIHTLFALAGNLANACKVLTLAPPAEGAPNHSPTERELHRLRAHRDQVVRQLQAGTDPDRLLPGIAQGARVSNATAALYLRTILPRRVEAVSGTLRADEAWPAAYDGALLHRFCQQCGETVKPDEATCPVCGSTRLGAASLRD